MSLPSSLKLLRQPRQHDGSSSEFHDQLDVLRDGGEVSTLSTSQQAPLDAVDLACPEPSHPSDSSARTRSDLPSWKHLILSPLATHERISLITTIFSNQDEVEAVRHLSGEDAQMFIDAIYEACSYILSSLKNGSTDFDPNSRVSSIRCLMTSTTRSG